MFLRDRGDYLQESANHERELSEINYFAKKGLAEWLGLAFQKEPRDNSRAFEADYTTRNIPLRIVFFIYVPARIEVGTYRDAYGIYSSCPIQPGKGMQKFKKTIDNLDICSLEWQLFSEEACCTAKARDVLKALESKT